MARPIKIQIDVTKINKDLLYQGKKGEYLNLVAFPLKSGPKENGDTHTVFHDITQEQRESGVENKILGNLRLPSENDRPGERVQHFPKDDGVQRDSDGSDSVPF